MNTQAVLAFREALEAKRPYCIACYSPLHLSKGFNAAYAPLLSDQAGKFYKTTPMWTIGKL